MIDAADDIEKDQKKNNFNPFVKKLIREREKPLEGEALDGLLQRCVKSNPFSNYFVLSTVVAASF